MSKIKRRVRGKKEDPERGGRLKMSNNAPLLPFHDIADDPYFIRV